MRKIAQRGNNHESACRYASRDSQNHEPNQSGEDCDAVKKSTVIGTRGRLEPVGNARRDSSDSRPKGSLLEVKLLLGRGDFFEAVLHAVSGEANPEADKGMFFEISHNGKSVGSPRGLPNRSVLTVSGRAGIAAIAVAVANLPVAAVDYDFSALVFCDLLGVANRLRLRVTNGTGALVPFALDGPPLRVRHNMLVCHMFAFFLLFVRRRPTEGGSVRPNEREESMVRQQSQCNQHW